jgi:hypothetical protein
MARKYENGYLPKIEYWTGKLKEAKEAGNVDGIVKAADKIAYFTTRQNMLYSREQEQLRAYDGQLRGDALLKAIGFFEKSLK